LCAEATLQNHERFTSSLKPGTPHPSLQKLYPTFCEMEEEEFDHVMFANSIPDSCFHLSEETQNTEVHGTLQPDQLSMQSNGIQSTHLPAGGNANDLSQSQETDLDSLETDHLSETATEASQLRPSVARSQESLTESKDSDSPEETKLRCEDPGAPPSMYISTCEWAMENDLGNSLPTNSCSDEKNDDPKISQRRDELSIAELMCGFSSEEATWSILTNEVSYPVHNTSCSSGNIVQTKQKQHQNSKKKCYRTDNQNEPETDIPYPNVKARTTQCYDPDTDVSATYLWSDPCISQQETTLSIPMDKECETLGFLLGATNHRINILLDSGANKNFISKRLLENLGKADTYPRFALKGRSIRMANNSNEPVAEAAKVVIKIGPHCLEIIAYIMTVSDRLDMILGSKALAELEANMDFPTLQTNIRNRSLPLYPAKDYVIYPGQERTLKVTAKGKPSSFPAGPAIIKLKNKMPDQVPSTLLQDTHYGDFYITYVNSGRKAETYSPDRSLGMLDMRSVGYYYKSRDQFEHFLEDSANFLNDQESEDFLHSIFHQKDRSDPKMRVDPTDPYPWLDPDDVRRHMTDEEIIRKYVDLTESQLSPEEKEKFYEVLIKHKTAFSLRDEIGVCPNLEVELQLNDTSPFFIRPFPVKEDNKPLVDNEIRKGCLLGILKKGMSSYSSPIMLIPRPNGGNPRMVTDFRHLNTRLVKLNPSIPLVRDAIQTLGASQCEVISVVDLKDAYHTLRLTESSKQYCGITPYHGSPTYLYQRLGMGLSVSPAIWQTFITTVLDEIPTCKHHLAIMDDCLIHSKRKDHTTQLIHLLKALIRHGLKISPKKCQFFRTRLTYMGHTLLIDGKTPCITPMKSRIDSIMKLNQPKGPRDCKSLCGMVNFLSFYLKDLQTILEPIYRLTRKNVEFKWGPEQQESFQKIKELLTKPPVLVMPNNYDLFMLFSDTSKIACGGALYQKQLEIPRLVAFHSKCLPDSAKRYTISELELTGMMCNISAFKQMLLQVDFEVYVDHSALVHIIKAKTEPATIRIQKLLEKLRRYSFVVLFQKGKDMQVADFLSRHPDNDLDDPHEVIPIAFSTRELSHIVGKERELDSLFWLKDMVTSDTCNITTRGMVKQGLAPAPSGKPPEIVRGKVVPIQGTTPPQQVVPQGDPANRQDKPMQHPRVQFQEEPQLIPEVIHPQFQLVPSLPPTQEHYPPKGKSRIKGDQVIPKILEPEGINEYLDKIHPVDVRLDGRLPSYLPEEPSSVPNYSLEDIPTKQAHPLFDFDGGESQSVRRTRLPKQVDIDKMLNRLQRKVLHDYNTPVTLKELCSAYLKDPKFKDIYIYLSRGYCTFTGYAQRTFKSECEDYILYQNALFKIKHSKLHKDESGLRLCIPKVYIPVVLHQYHDMLLSGHFGTVKMYETIQRKYYFPDMILHIRQYIQACTTCASQKPGPPLAKAHFPRIARDFVPMAHLSLDTKEMPRSPEGFKHILLCTCEISNWTVGIPIVDVQSQTLFEALFHRVFCVYGPPRRIITDEATGLTSLLVTRLCAQMKITQLLISPMNHGSNRTERYIRTIQDRLISYLNLTGENWPLFVSTSVYAMNTFVSPVTGYSPFELVFLRPAPDILAFDFNPDTSGLTLVPSEYMKLMQKRKHLITNLILGKRKHTQDMQLSQEQ